MTFRIQKSIDKRAVTLSLSGQLDDEGIAELRRLIDHYTDGHQLILDLEDVGLVDGDAIRSLTVFESLGIRLVNSPIYVRDWMSREVGKGVNYKKSKNRRI